MKKTEKLAAFLEKWDGRISEDSSFSDDCSSLGFEMDAGRSLSDAFPDVPVLRAEGFRRIAGRITKIRFLGTAIHSYWRYRTHWCDEPGGGVDCEEAREWFRIAFDRMGAPEREREMEPLIFSGAHRRRIRLRAGKPPEEMAVSAGFLFPLSGSGESSSNPACMRRCSEVA